MSREPGMHANFRDPVGLLLRMLRSGDRAARGTLVREVAGIALFPLDRLLALAEERRLRTAPDTMQPLVLIVGAPRSGTTLVYQALARYLPVTYFTNLSALFPHAPITASRLFLRRQRPSAATFHSYYGNTTGLAEPNDGFHVWNRWLGNDRYRAPETLADDVVAEMRRFFAAWTATFGRPLLNKNNRNTDGIALLGRVLPEAYFVVVRRDPVFVVQSLLIARQHIQGDTSRKWGLLSQDQEPDSGPFGHIDTVCRQVENIERRIAAECATLPASRLIEVSYETFCARPANVIEDVYKRVWGAPADLSAAHQELALIGGTTNQPRLSPEELARIRSTLAELADERSARDVG